MTAAKRYAKSKIAVSAARSGLHRLMERLDAAQASQNPERIERAERAVAGAKDRLRKAIERMKTLGGVASLSASAAARADALLMKSAGAQAAWRKGRQHDRGTGAKIAADRREQRQVLVDSPYGALHGKDQVKRIVKTIEGMHRRRQLGDPGHRERAAADRFVWAYEACPEGIRCAIDQSGGGGGGFTTRSPSEQALLAAGWLRDARRLLGVRDYEVVRRVCGEGRSIEHAAAKGDRRPKDQETRLVGARLRESLTTLADEWWPGKMPLQTRREADAKPAGVIERESWDQSEFKGRVAHAADSGERGARARGRVFGFESREGDRDLKLDQSKKRKSRKVKK